MSDSGYQPPTYEPTEHGQSAGEGYGRGTETNGMAIAALVVGILALLSFFTVLGGVILGIAAIILGAVGVSRAKQMNGSGKGMAIGGIVTGVIGLLLALLLAFGLFALGTAIERGEINPTELFSELEG